MCDRRRTWTTRDKRKIPIEDLEDDHLVNIIKMLLRRLFSFPRMDGRWRVKGLIEGEAFPT